MKTIKNKTLFEIEDRFSLSKTYVDGDPHKAIVFIFRYWKREWATLYIGKSPFYISFYSQRWFFTTKS